MCITEGNYDQHIIYITMSSHTSHMCNIGFLSLTYIIMPSQLLIFLARAKSHYILCLPTLLAYANTGYTLISMSMAPLHWCEFAMTEHNDLFWSRVRLTIFLLWCSIVVYLEFASAIEHCAWIQYKLSLNRENLTFTQNTWLQLNNASYMYRINLNASKNLTKPQDYHTSIITD